MADALPFQEAIDFLSQKVRLPSQAWTDLKEGAHARAFVVAGAVKDALVADFHAAIIRAEAEGRTKEQFLTEDFDRIVEKHGWDYKGGRRWRSAVIYNTNMRMAAAAGRWAQIRTLASQLAAQGRTVYLRYSAVLDGGTRDQHRKWGTEGGHGIILPWDDPWWDSHFPPNDWGCRCTVQLVTDDVLKAKGWSVTPPDKLPMKMEDRPVNTSMGKENWPTPEGIGTGFGYNVGKSWLSGAVPRQLEKPLPPMGVASEPHDLPPLVPHPLDKSRLLETGQSDEFYVEKFLAEFGASLDRPAPFRDASGTLLGIGRESFLTAGGRFKVKKNEREITLLLLADALKNPDEIWVDWTPLPGRDPVLRRRYLRAMDIPKAGVFPGGHGLLSVFEWSAAGWWGGVTTFPPEKSKNLMKQRSGALIWKRR